jgi:peptidyl-prolyl cis-trans isomerase A (cyclophilin A)
MAATSRRQPQCRAKVRPDQDERRCGGAQVRFVRRSCILLDMSRRIVLPAALSIVLLSATSWSQAPANPRVVIETTEGRIDVVLDPARAPRTVENFLRYVDERFFDGAAFYRTVTPANQPDNLVKIEVIQGGVDGARPARDPIALERTSVTGLKHVDGAISMARNGPDTATTEFFICVGDQPELDFGGKRNADGQGFAAFGHVTAGMEVVRRIHQAPVTAQRLSPPIVIRSIRRAE